MSMSFFGSIRTRTQEAQDDSVETGHCKWVSRKESRVDDGILGSKSSGVTSFLDLNFYLPLYVDLRVLYSYMTTGLRKSSTKKILSQGVRFLLRWSL